MCRPLRILMVSSSLEDDGGLPVSVGRLSMALADLGHCVEITGQHASDVAAVIATAAAHPRVRVTPFRHPWNVFGQIRAARLVWRLVRDRSGAADTTGEHFVVHVHGVWALPVLAGALAAWAAGAQRVILPHGMLRAEPMKKSAFRKWLVFQSFLRQILSRANVVQATSQAEAADLKRLMPDLHPRIVPLGIFSPPVIDKRQDPDERRIAGYLGRIIPIKNLDTLLRAWAAAADSQWQLRLAGPGDARYVSELQSLATSLGLGERVRFESAVPHASVRQFLGGLDLFIYPSKSESFALGIGEALAAGLPVIVTTAAPWSGVIEHACGWEAAPTQANLEIVIRAATTCDRQKLASMGHRGAAWIRRDFSWPAIASRHVDELYNATPESHT